MIEPRALAVLSIDPADPHIWSIEMAKEVIFDMPKGRYLLTTIADVLAALRQPSAAMIEAGDKQYEGTLIVEEAFLAMLDQFEHDQRSAT